MGCEPSIVTMAPSIDRWSGVSMAPAGRCTVFVDVLPTVLHGALVVVLERLGIDVVIDLKGTAPIDAAIVSVEHSSPNVKARVVITLPEWDGDEVEGTVAVEGEPARVRITGIDDLLELLELAPTPDG